MYKTAHFTEEEFIRSTTATAKHIDNSVPSRLLNNMKDTLNMLEKIRTEFGAPIWISSGYRSDKLNKAIGGSTTSQHSVALAADIKACKGHTNKELFDCIYNMVKKGVLKVGQLINEFNYSWVHVSLPYTKVNDIRDAVKKNGVTSYPVHK